MAPLKKEKRVSLKKEKVKNYRIISNALTVKSKGIT
jgi:hypothetical protein